MKTKFRNIRLSSILTISLKALFITGFLFTVSAYRTAVPFYTQNEAYSIVDDSTTIHIPEQLKLDLQKALRAPGTQTENIKVPYKSSVEYFMQSIGEEAPKPKGIIPEHQKDMLIDLAKQIE